MSKTQPYHGMKDLAEIHAHLNGKDYKEAYEDIRAFMKTLEYSLMTEDSRGIQFIDFLTLQKVVRKPHLGRNPKTGEEYIIPEKLKIKVLLGKKFDKKLNDVV